MLLQSMPRSSLFGTKTLTGKRKKSSPAVAETDKRMGGRDASEIKWFAELCNTLRWFVGNTSSAARDAYYMWLKTTRRPTCVTLALTGRRSSQQICGQKSTSRLSLYCSHFIASILLPINWATTAFYVHVVHISRAANYHVQWWRRKFCFLLP